MYFSLVIFSKKKKKGGLFTYNKEHPLEFAVSFDKCMYLCKYHSKQYIRYFHLPKYILHFELS